VIRLLLLFPLLATCGAPAQVTVELPENAPPMLEFAKREILEATRDFEASLRVTTRQGAGGAESFRTLVEGDTVTVEAGDARGLMYGLLDVAEQLRIGGSVQGRDERPFLRYRMIKFNPPLKGNTYLSAEDRANSAWFFDLEYWDRFFSMMARARYNAVSFWHSHPFGEMVRLAKYPEAAVLQGDEMDKAIRFWHALYKLAEEHGIDVHWVTWNIHTTPQFAKAHGIRDAGVDSPLVRDYMKECVREMLREYPEIDGFGTCPGEAMGGLNATQREEFIRECYLEPMRETGRDMPLIHRYWGGEPGAVSAMLGDAKYPGDVLLDIKFNGEHMYSSEKAHVKDRTWLDQQPRPYQILWHLRNDDIYQLNWGDPWFASALMKNCAGSAGFVMGSEVEVPGADRYHTAATEWHEKWKYTFEKHWFRWMVWGRAGYDPEMDPSVWEGLYSVKYGPEIGPKVCEAIEVASKIVPMVTSFHWNYMNGDWYPEGNIGSWNTSAEMPLRNFRRKQMWHDTESYIFNNTIDASMISIPEETARSVRPVGGEASALRLAADEVGTALSTCAEQCLRAVDQISWLALGDQAETDEEILKNKGIEELDCDLRDLHVWGLLGSYYAKKLEAAYALAAHLFGVDPKQAAKRVKLAQEAAEAWEKLAAAADGHYVPHEVWLMGQFSWRMYNDDARRDVELAKRATPIPREDRPWRVGDEEVRTVRWSHVGDAVRDHWIDMMNGIAGLVRTRAATASTHVAVPEGRSVRVTFVGEGLVRAAGPGGVLLSPEEPSAVVSVSGELTVQLDPSKSQEGFRIDVSVMPEDADQILLPARHGKLTAPLAVSEDEGSLYEQCIVVAGEAAQAGVAVYDFTVSPVLEYEVWARVRPGPAGGKFTVGIDTLGTWEATAAAGGWHWVRVPGTVRLSEGGHTLEVRSREGGLALDEVRLVPAGLDARKLLPLTWDEGLQLFSADELQRQMVAYYRKMTPIRPPRHTESRAAWEAWRKEIRAVVLRDIGLDETPKDLALDPRIVATLERDGYAVNRIYFQLFPGCYGSGWLYVPTGLEGKAPAILNPHGHWEHRAYDPEAQARMIGLVKKGYIALMTDNIHAGDFETGMTPIGLMTWQNIRALDYLCSREDVDNERLGITGASGGGQQAMYMMAVDDRLKVAVPVVMACYFERIVTFGDWHCWCNHAPGISSDTDMIELLSVFAPRPALFICSTQDWTAKFPQEEYKEVQKVWGLYGAEGETECVISEEPHGYGKARREAMYSFFSKHLGVEDSDEGREPEIVTESLGALQAMDKPMEGLRDWAKAVEWYRKEHVAVRPPSDIAARVAELVRAVPPVKSEVGGEVVGRLELEAGSVERLLIKSEPGLKIPALLVWPEERASKCPVAVLLMREGKGAAFVGERTPHALVAALLSRGVAVLALDARLTGELDRNWERNCIIWGRPEAGMAADDARWAAAYLASRDDVDRRRISVIGLGRMGVPALLAALLGEFSACVFDATGRTYTTAPLHDAQGYYAGDRWLRDLGLAAIPGILRVADLPGLAAACEAPVAILNAAGADYGEARRLRSDDWQAVASFIGEPGT
jgi:dipeptidyl aminopeptidase/acylaminoacyl peptidase